MDEPMETNAQLRQHRIHIFPIHGLPHVLHLPTDVGAYLGASLPEGETDRESWKIFKKQSYLNTSSAYSKMLLVLDFTTITYCSVLDHHIVLIFRLKISLLLLCCQDMLHLPHHAVYRSVCHRQQHVKENSLCTIIAWELEMHWPVNPCVQFHFHLLNHLFLLVQALCQLWRWAGAQILNQCNNRILWNIYLYIYI